MYDIVTRDMCIILAQKQTLFHKQYIPIGCMVVLVAKTFKQNLHPRSSSVIFLC